MHAQNQNRNTLFSEVHVVFSLTTLILNKYNEYLIMLEYMGIYILNNTTCLIIAMCITTYNYNKFKIKILVNFSGILPHI